MKTEFLIIDAYNVIHELGMFPASGMGPGSLGRICGSFLEMLAAQIPLELRKRTTIVFDARSAPPEGFSPSQIIGEMQVLFAIEEPEADDLIEYLIKRHSAPKQLTVVSSDHRLQTAARRRNARTVDSDSWIDSIQEEEPDSDDDVRQTNPRLKHHKLDAAEVEAWMEEFQVDANEIQPDRPPKANQPKTGKHSRQNKQSKGRSSGPFPPGYADDLLDEF